jgi:hypothetical protein
MNGDAQSARDDLAFLKTLVGEDEYSGRRALGEAYFAGGLIYGAQMLLHAAQALGWMSQAAFFGLLIGLGPTVLFIPVIIWIAWRNRTNRPSGIVGRAVGAVFATIGLSNLVLIVVVGAVAWREQNLQTWLIFPCCVFVLQGLAWMFAYIMLVAAGWFVCAVAMALSVASVGYFIAFAGFGLWVCMALPGWIMMRRSSGAG